MPATSAAVERVCSVAGRSFMPNKCQDLPKCSVHQEQQNPQVTLDDLSSDTRRLGFEPHHLGASAHSTKARLPNPLCYRGYMEGVEADVYIFFSVCVYCHLYTVLFCFTSLAYAAYRFLSIFFRKAPIVAYIESTGRVVS